MATPARDDECATCRAALAARYWSFDRLVERFDYDRQGDTPGACATVTVLSSETLSMFCSRDCAWLTALLSLTERGIRIVNCGAGPIEICAKCSGPLDLTKPHVLYQLMDQTETRRPWLTTVQPHETESLAYVCPRCDGGLVSDELNVADSDTETILTGTQELTPSRKS